MADTVAITAGSGTTIGTDEVTIGGTAQHLQRIKLFDGTNGGTAAASVTTENAVKVAMVALGSIKTQRVADTGGSSTAFTAFSATTLLRNYITAVTVYNANTTTSGYVDFRDGTGGSVIWTFPAPKGGGVAMTFDPPLRQPTTNTALAYDVSGAITTVYISANGFQA